MRLLTCIILLKAVFASQQPIASTQWSDPGSRMTPASDMKLASLGREFMEFAHPAYPLHSMKIKSTTGWCDPGVNSYSGYLNTGNGKDLFFYFFESRSSPEDDPVIMWINGGPGCSSELGLFMELGPCSISNSTNVNGTEINPHSWNNKANIFFLDEPIGVGYSFAKHGQTVATTEQAAIDIQAFVALFFSTFGYQGREFIMAGESYGGRYLPLFASAVLDGNKRMIRKGLAPVNLTRVMIGNGISDTFSMAEAYYLYQCITLPDMDAPLQSIGNCVAMAKALPMCKEAMQAECIDRHDYLRCQAALMVCEANIGSSFWDLGLNPYDVSKPCSIEELNDGLCYGPIINAISQYLDLPEVRSLLGVDKSIGKYASCSERVFVDFNAALDISDQTWLYIAALLERRVEILAYVGAMDWICNAIGNEQTYMRLEWTGGDGFRKTSKREWSVAGKPAGYTKSYGGLTFATVSKAGHMVPYDKPVEALEMLNRFISGEQL